MAIDVIKRESVCFYIDVYGVHKAKLSSKQNETRSLIIQLFSSHLNSMRRIFTFLGVSKITFEADIKKFNSSNVGKVIAAFYDFSSASFKLRSYEIQYPSTDAIVNLEDNAKAFENFQRICNETGISVEFF